MDAQLVELQVAYQRMEWEKSQSSDGSLLVCTSPEPTNVTQTTELQDPTEDTGSRNANITSSSIPNTKAAVTDKPSHVVLSTAF